MPPRGIRYEHEPSRKAPFQVRWRNSEGERKRQGFASAAAREEFARELAKQRAEHGKSILDFDPKEWQRWLEFKWMVKDVDPVRVAVEWLQGQEKKGGAAAVGSLTVREAWTKYRAVRFAEERLSPDTWRHIDKHVGERFAGALGTMRLHDVTADHVREWLRSLKHPKTGAPMESLTRRHHRKDVNTFFDRAVREGWVMRNPCDLVALPAKETEDDVSVIPVRDAFEFFKANADSPEVARVALEAFGGLRYKTAGRLQHGSVNFVEKGLELPGAIHKSGKRKFRQGHPDNLWTWLELAKEKEHAAWGMTLRQYAEAKRGALTRARLRPLVARTQEEKDGLRELRNVWRHSFASYLLAKTKNLPIVQYLMQHRHSSTTEIYEGVATERDARLYFAITPETVKLTWEEFEVLGPR